MSDWAKEAGERRRQNLQASAEHAQELKDQRARDAPVFDRLVDETVRAIVDHAVQRMKSYADASGENLQTGRQPSGGMWVEKAAHPSGRLDIKLDRIHGMLSSEAVFSQKDGRRPFVGAKHDANFVVSDDGERLLLQIGSATPREGIAVVDDWLREFVDRISR
jgi:hypothetical protein